MTFDQSINRARNRPPYVSNTLAIHYVLNKGDGGNVICEPKSVCAIIALGSQIVVQLSSGGGSCKICIPVLDRSAKSAHAIGRILKSIGYQVFVTTDQSETGR